MLKAFKTSNKAHVLVLLSIFAVMLVFNILTEKIADDFTYSFSFATGETIGSFGDLIDSMKAHGEILNGRYFSHSLVQLLLLLPPIVFDLINSAMFVAILYITYATVNHKKEKDNLLLVGIFGFLWLFEHNFGQVNFWLDGSVNYQFALFFGLLFIIPFINSFMRGRNFNPFLIPAHMILSFWFGGYIEPVSVGFVCSAVIFVILDVFYNKNKRALLFIPSIIASLLGFAVIALTPSHLDKKLTTFSFIELLKMFGMSLLMILSILPIIAAYVILYKRAKEEGVDNRIILTAHAIGLGALASNFVLILASYFVLRCTICLVFMSVFATALLYANVKNRNFGEKGRLCEKIFAIALCLALLIGLTDNIITFSVIQQNETVIEQAVENGETEVEIKKPFPFTKYNAAKGLVYLEEGDGNAWPNNDMAKYYGLERIKAK